MACVIAGCSGAKDQGAPGLRVGDQIKTLQITLKAAGEDKIKDYRVEWSNFLGGPAIIAAQTGGSVDLGWMTETPLVFAQAAGSPVKVVAVSRGTQDGGGSVALATSPNSPIRSIRDLKGKKIGYSPGTNTQYLVARVLDSVGLSLADIQTVRVSGMDSASLARGDVDAFVTPDPQLTRAVQEGKLRVLAYAGAPYTPAFSYLVASEAALADPRKSALIGEFVARVARATRWQTEHVTQAAPLVAKGYGISPELATQILRRAPAQYVPIDAAVITEHQKEADLFLKLGAIRKRVDAAKLFDKRYNPVVAQAEAGR